MLVYVRESLGDEEEIIHAAHFHWTYSVLAVLNIFYGIVGAIIVIILGVKFAPQFLGGYPPEAAGWVTQVQLLHPGIKILAFILLILGIYKFARMMIIKATTEIAVTNVRLIYKVGLIARSVGEINTDRIEGVDVMQGLFGRLLGFGHIIIRGMGIGELLLPPIADPIRFRKAIDRARNI